MTNHTSARPPRPPTNPSEYDGHDHYRERFAPKPPVDRLQTAVLVPLVVVMWFVGGVFSYRLIVGDSRNGGEVLVLGGLCWVVVGPIVAIVYGSLTNREAVRQRPLLWFAWIVAGALLGALAFTYW